jgi:uncharacterized protein HemY
MTTLMILGAVIFLALCYLLYRSVRGNIRIGRHIKHEKEMADQIRKMQKEEEGQIKGGHPHFQTM